VFINSSIISQCDHLIKKDSNIVKKKNQFKMTRPTKNNEIGKTVVISFHLIRINSMYHFQVQKMTCMQVGMISST
jgi:hypothetical protein